MKDISKSVITFFAWCVILLSAFLLIILCSIPAYIIAKPVIIIAAVLIIISTVAVRIFDPAFFAKKITAATGK